jgi:hypothetical protein
MWVGMLTVHGNAAYDILAKMLLCKCEYMVHSLQNIRFTHGDLENQLLAIVLDLKRVQN